MKTNNRVQKLKEAIDNNLLPILGGVIVGTPSELARISGVSASTIRYAYCMGGVQTIITAGCILYVNALDLLTYFLEASPGRKKIKQIS